MISSSVTNRTSAVVSPEIASNATLTCVVMEGSDEFGALAPLWRELADRATDRSPSLAWPWLRAWWDLFGAECPKTGRRGNAYVVIVYDELMPVAAYPFVYHPAPWWNPGLRRLRPMGHSGELEPSGLTEEPICVVATGYEERARAMVVDHLSEQVTRGRWDCALVRQLNHDESARPSRPLSAVAVRTKTKTGPQIVRLPSTWAEFRRMLTKSMRDNLAYYPKLIKRAGWAHSVTLHTDPDAIEDAVSALVSLHRDRVYSKVGHKHQDYFNEPWQPEMMRRGFSDMAREGRGFIATLEIENQVVAAQSFLQTDSELLVHYSGFDPEYAKYSPLLVLQAEVFRRAIEERGVRKLNLLFGSSQWQKRWTSQSEGAEIRTLILRKRPLSLIRAAAYALGREIVATARRSGLRRWWDGRTYRPPLQSRKTAT